MKLYEFEFPHYPVYTLASCFVYYNIAFLKCAVQTKFKTLTSGGSVSYVEPLIKSTPQPLSLIWLFHSWTPQQP